MAAVSFGFSHGTSEQALEKVILESFAALSPERQAELLPRLAACLCESATVPVPPAVGRMLSGEAECEEMSLPNSPVCGSSEHSEESRVWEDVWTAIQEERCRSMASVTAKG